MKTTAKIIVKGRSISFSETPGEGSPIVFLHGHGRTRDDWAGVAAHLPGRRIIAPDLVGYGESDRPPDVPYDLEFHREHLLEFLDARGVSEALLVGHSTGASIAARAAADSNDVIAALMMFAPAGVPGSLKLSFPKNLLYRPGFGNRLARYLAKSRPFRSLFPERLTHQMLGLSSSFGEGYVDGLREIKQPTLLTWSASDDTCLSAYRNVYESQIRDLTFAHAPVEAGHDIPSNHPKFSAKLIRAFLSKLNLSR